MRLPVQPFHYIGAEVRNQSSDPSEPRAEIPDSPDQLVRT